MLENSLPENYRLLYSAEEISLAIQTLAPEISTWLCDATNRDGLEPLVIPILRGGLYFGAALSRELTSPVTIEVARASAYIAEENRISEAPVRVEIDGIDSHGRAVLLVDDICETGKTLHATYQAFLERGASEVKTCVLVRRLPTSSPVTPDWSCFEYHGSDWLVGYGMDDRGRLRNVSGVYRMNPNG